MTIAELRERHRRVGLDSNVLIYVFERNPLAARLRPLFELIEEGAMQAVLASIGLTEILAGPARARDGTVFEGIAAELRSLPNLRVQQLDTEAAVDAAWLRGEGVATIDAIHLACAARAGATAFITNDRRLRSSPGLEIIQLTDLEAA